MKKLTLALVITLTLIISVYCLSCKKEAQALLLPAIQRIREVPTKNWEIADKALLQLPITFSEKLKPEFTNFEADSNIVVSCWVKFKDMETEKRLPFSMSDLSGTKYYFFTIEGGKAKVLFHNTAVNDFNTGGTGSAMLIEQVSFNYTKIEY